MHTYTILLKYFPIIHYNILVGFIIKMAVNERKRKLNSSGISIMKEAELTAFQEKTVENSVADKSIHLIVFLTGIFE